MNKKPSLMRSVGVGLIVIFVVVVYAYGFSVTEVDFTEARSEVRLTGLFRVLRALAHPDLVERDMCNLIFSNFYRLTCFEALS